MSQQHSMSFTVKHCVNLFTWVIKHERQTEMGLCHLWHVFVSQVQRQVECSNLHNGIGNVFVGFLKMINHFLIIRSPPPYKFPTY